MGVYQWKAGSFFLGDAQKIGDEIESLPVKTPEAVVNAARNKRSAMHSCFTWDTDEAAKKWNLHEARLLVGSIVTIAEVGNDKVEFRAFESVVVADRRQYVQVKEIVGDDELREQVLGEIRAGISELSHKAKVYEHLAPRSFQNIQHQLDLAKEEATA